MRQGAQADDRRHLRARHADEAAGEAGGGFEGGKGHGNVTGVVLVLVALVSVAVMAYRAGYVRGQDELPRQGQPAEAECSVLQRWRRVAGLAAYGFAGLLNCLFLGLAFLYAKRWGWAVSLAAWALWFALFIGAIWLGEWCWQPYRAAQARLRQKQTEILRALEGRANKEDSA